MRIKKKNLILDKSIKFHKFRGSEYIEDFFENRFKGSNVLVYFDPDVDGLVAGMFACKSLSMRGIPFSWYINSNREHGFSLPIDKVKGMSIFCVDFHMSFEEIKRLVDAGCNVLSIDHHDNKENFIEYSANGKKGIVINNQYDFEEESGRYQSGAGVVFESLLPYFGDEFNTRENRALVGLTLLTDIRNIENINARLYLQELYTHPYKGYIGYLLDNTLGDVDYSFGVPRLDRNYVDFSFSPIINSCLRFNRQDEVVEFMLGSGLISKKFHTIQKELVANLYENSRVIQFSNLNVVIVDVAKFRGMEYDDMLSNFIGLLASKYLDSKRSAIAYIVDGKKVGRASFRGRVNGLDYLNKLVKYVDGVGHGPAFGIKNLKPSKKLFTAINEECKLLEEGTDFSVEYVKTGNLSMMANTRAYDMGIDNIYCLSQNRKYILYTGKNVKERRNGAKYKEYSIDGVSVLSFDVNLDPCKDLILPIIERGVLCFYLNKSSEGVLSSEG
ncbi:DHH family phosphoesterase [Clostridium baratii]